MEESVRPVTKLFQCLARVLDDLTIDELDAAVRRQGCDQAGNTVEDRAGALFFFAQRGLGLPERLLALAELPFPPTPLVVLAAELRVGLGELARSLRDAPFSIGIRLRGALGSTPSRFARSWRSLSQRMFSPSGRFDASAGCTATDEMRYCTLVSTDHETDDLRGGRASSDELRAADHRAPSASETCFDSGSSHPIESGFRAMVP